MGKQLNILLTNKELVTVGGSETWTSTMASALIRRGHKVFVMALGLGPFAWNMKYLCGDELELVMPNTLAPESEFDLILCNHQACFNACIDLKLKGPMIYTSHGVQSTDEQVRGDMFNRAQIVAISPEVRRNIAQSTIRPEYQIEVIPQPIDLDQFYYSKPAGVRHLSVLTASDNEEFIHCLAKALSTLDTSYDLHVINKAKPVYSPAQYLHWANVCVGVGRFAQEAMACGRNVIIADNRPTYESRGLIDGLVTPDNFEALAAYNFSGRMTRTVVDEHSLAQAFSQLLKIYADNPEYEGTKEISNKIMSGDDVVRKYFALVGKKLRRL